MRQLFVGIQEWWSRMTSTQEIGLWVWLFCALCAGTLVYGGYTIYEHTRPDIDDTEKSNANEANPSGLQIR